MAVNSPIYDRLQRAYDSLLLIHAAAHCVATDAAYVEKSELGEVIERQSVVALDELYWVKRLPASVMNLPAPTDDEVRDAGGNDCETGDLDVDAELEKIIAGHLSKQAGRLVRRAGGAR